MEITGAICRADNAAYYGRNSCPGCPYAFDWDGDNTCQCRAQLSVNDQKTGEHNGRNVYYDCPKRVRE